MATKVFCNQCGAEIKEYEFHLSDTERIGYGSVHDGDELDFDLCAKCTDELITYLTERCSISPLHEEPGYYL